jgi:hypothetical protein
MEVEDATDTPLATNVCTVGVCNGMSPGQINKDPTPNPTLAQTPNDCLHVYCRRVSDPALGCLSAGAAPGDCQPTSTIFDDDFPLPDGNQCTNDICKNGVPYVSREGSLCNFVGTLDGKCTVNEECLDNPDE